MIDLLEIRLGAYSFALMLFKGMCQSDSEEAGA
jgi:hypothetical protein